MLLGGSEKEGKRAKRVRARGGGDKVYGQRAAHDEEGEASGTGAEGMRGKGTDGEGYSRRAERRGGKGWERQQGMILLSERQDMSLHGDWGGLQVRTRGREGRKRRAGGKGKGRDANSSGGGEGAEEKHEGQMRARALPERRASHGKAGTGGRVHAQRGSPCGRERLGVQRHRGPTSRSVKPVSSKKYKSLLYNTSTSW